MFVTASTPMSRHEEIFVQDELTAMHAAGRTLWVVPARRKLREPNSAASQSGLGNVTIGRSMVDGSIGVTALSVFALHPLKVLTWLWRVTTSSGSLRSLAVNVAVLPKALWLSHEVRRLGVHHLHAYWLSHTATLAMVAADIAGVTWSGTGFRWDVDAANAFRWKLRSATFLRCADELGRQQLRERTAATAPDRSPPIVLVRTGVAIPPLAEVVSVPVRTDELCCVGMFVPKKAHTLLVHALHAARRQRADVRLVLLGDGPERDRIRREVERLNLGAAVEFRGAVELEDLRAHLRTRPITVHPSIVAADGQQEGIPVSLVESMANGSPIITAPTGSIATLVTDGCGVLVQPGDVDALADAIVSVSSDNDFARSLAENAYRRLAGEFDIAKTSARLYGLCAEAAQ